MGRHSIEDQLQSDVKFNIDERRSHPCKLDEGGEPGRLMDTGNGKQLYVGADGSTSSTRPIAQHLYMPTI
jgi:hypothetical protein